MKVTNPNFNPSNNEAVDAIKRKANELAAVIDQVCPEGRRRSKALTDLESCSMFAVKSLFAEADELP